MRVLVTGVGGFIAPHVAHAFRSAGHEVIGFDLRPVAGTGYPIVVGDLLDAPLLANTLAGVDAVCHLAGVGDVYLAAGDPLLAVQGNVAATTQLTLAAAAAGVRRVIFASTWEVYGTPLYQPVDEGHPTRPDHPYNITKLAAEHMGMSLGALKGVSFIALRLGTAYGAGMRPNAVLRIFADRARTGRPLTIKGTGEQFRQFTHAADIARAFCLAAERDVPPGAYNIVAPEKITIRQLAEAVIARFKGEIIYEPARAADVPPAEVSADRAQRVIGWEPKVPFRDGVKTLLDELASGDAATAPVN